MANEKVLFASYSAKQLVHTPNDVSKFLRGDNIFSNALYNELIITSNISTQNQIINSLGVYTWALKLKIDPDNVDISGNVNLTPNPKMGLFSEGVNTNKWILYEDTEGVYFKGEADTATKLSNTPGNKSTFLRGDNKWTNELCGPYVAIGETLFQFKKVEPSENEQENRNTIGALKFVNKTIQLILPQDNTGDQLDIEIRQTNDRLGNLILNQLTGTNITLNDHIYNTSQDLYSNSDIKIYHSTPNCEITIDNSIPTISAHIGFYSNYLNSKVILGLTNSNKLILLQPDNSTYALTSLIGNLNGRADEATKAYTDEEDHEIINRYVHVLQGKYNNNNNNNTPTIREMALDGVSIGLCSASGANIPTQNGYYTFPAHCISIAEKYDRNSSNPSSYYISQMIFGNQTETGLWYRTGYSGYNSLTTWHRVLDSISFDMYAVKLDGSNVKKNNDTSYLDWEINIKGNAATATNAKRANAANEADYPTGFKRRQSYQSTNNNNNNLVRGLYNGTRIPGILISRWLCSGSDDNEYGYVEWINNGTLIGNTPLLGNAMHLYVNGNIYSGGGFYGTFNGNATTATTWQTPRTLTLTGAVTGYVSIDGSSNVSLDTTATHTHLYAGSDMAGGAANYVQYLNNNEINFCTGVSSNHQTTVRFNWKHAYNNDGIVTAHALGSNPTVKYYFGNYNGSESSSEIWAGRVYNAYWNDYAEFRTTLNVEPGQVVVDCDDGTIRIADKRLLPGAQIVSDTYGHAMGQTDATNTPIAVAGRVLAYPYQDHSKYHAGMAVCSAPNGTVDIMSKLEIVLHPDCIIGYVSEIPTYEEWGPQKIKVNNRIWISVR